MQSVTLICGPDDFLVTRRGQDTWAQLSDGIEDDFAKEVVDGQAGNLAEVDEALSRFISAVQTMPMFGDRKVVWFKNISFFGDARPGGTEGAKAAIEKLRTVLEGIGEGGAVQVLLTASPFSRRSKKLVDWWKKHSDYQFLEGDSDGAGLMLEMEREAKANEVTIATDASRLLLAKINGNTRLALEEVRKLAVYLGEAGAEITESHVAELVPNFGEGDFFEATEAFYALDLPWALAAIRRHFFAGHDGRPMISSLQNRNRLLLQLKVLQDARVLGERISKNGLEAAARRYAEHFGGSVEKSSFNVFSQNPWYLGRLAQPLPRLNLRKLIDFQAAFLDAFRGILDRPNEQEMVMRETAVKCLG
jgi:DNA polymerase-3 subunit delta